MCGRFALSREPGRYADYFDASISESLEELQPNYNVAPTDRVYGVIQADQGRRLGVLKWGLVPYWSESPKDGAKRINARAETVATKPIFRDAFARRRCLLPADGFYEWQKKDDGTKQPIYIFGATHAPLGLAGIWERWKDAEGQVLTTCSVITTRPNALMAPIHDRMPVVLPQDQWKTWLDPDVEDIDMLTSLLQPAPEGLLETVKVATNVNNVRNKGPECLQPPIEDAKPAQEALFDV